MDSDCTRIRATLDDTKAEFKALMNTVRGMGPFYITYPHERQAAVEKIVTV